VLNTTDGGLTIALPAFNMEVGKKKNDLKLNKVDNKKIGLYIKATP